MTLKRGENMMKAVSPRMSKSISVKSSEIQVPGCKPSDLGKKPGGKRSGGKRRAHNL